MNRCFLLFLLLSVQLVHAPFLAVKGAHVAFLDIARFAYQHRFPNSDQNWYTRAVELTQKIEYNFKTCGISAYFPLSIAVDSFHKNCLHVVFEEPSENLNPHKNGLTMWSLLVTTAYSHQLYLMVLGLKTATDTDKISVSYTAIPAIQSAKEALMVVLMNISSKRQIADHLLRLAISGKCPIQYAYMLGSTWFQLSQEALVLIVDTVIAGEGSGVERSLVKVVQATIADAIRWHAETLLAIELECKGLKTIEILLSNRIQIDRPISVDQWTCNNVVLRKALPRRENINSLNQRVMWSEESQVELLLDGPHPFGSKLFIRLADLLDLFEVVMTGGWMVAVEESLIIYSAPSFKTGGIKFCVANSLHTRPNTTTIKQRLLVSDIIGVAVSMCDAIIPIQMGNFLVNPIEMDNNSQIERIICIWLATCTRSWPWDRVNEAVRQLASNRVRKWLVSVGRCWHRWELMSQHEYKLLLTKLHSILTC